MDRPVRIGRRRFLGSSFAAWLIAACGGGEATTNGPVVGTDAPATDPPLPTPSTSTTPPTTVAPRAALAPGWLAAENARPGTTDWKIDDDVPGASDDLPPGWLEGYADTTSARPGQSVQLFVACDGDSWHAEAYRMGWYGGAGGRLLWTSDEIPTQWQLRTTRDRTTKMNRAHWDPSLTFTVGDDWPPGAYLVKLVSNAGPAHYVPLTVRDDQAVGSLMVVSAVATWQAYNPWGGCSLYECFDGPGRSTVVSFDRPYARTYGHGSADFLTHELPLIGLIEELGIDTVYATNVDLHTTSLAATPDGADVDDSLDRLLAGRTALLSTGHDEYYSTPMRNTLEAARERGINLAFFGANAVYRHVRLEPNEEGRPFRQMPNYRTAGADPLTPTAPEQSTVQWRNDPLSRPESALIGVQYFAAGITGNLRVVSPDNWIFEGLDVERGTSFRKLIAIEVDGLGPKSAEPENLEVLASSPIRFKDSVYEHAMTYYAHESGAGVFATGTIAWIHALDTTWPDDTTREFVRGATTNVLRAFAAGPTGRAHPSRPNADRYRTSTRPDNDPSE